MQRAKECITALPLCFVDIFKAYDLVNRNKGRFFFLNQLLPTDIPVSTQNSNSTSIFLLPYSETSMDTFKPTNLFANVSIEVSTTFMHKSFLTNFPTPPILFSLPDHHSLNLLPRNFEPTFLLGYRKYQPPFSTTLHITPYSSHL